MHFCIDIQQIQNETDGPKLAPQRHQQEKVSSSNVSYITNKKQKQKYRWTQLGQLTPIVGNVVAIAGLFKFFLAIIYPGTTC